MSKKKIVIISTVALVIVIGIVLWFITAKNEASGYRYSDENITLGYVPDGMELVSKDIGIKTKVLYFSDGERYFNITINSLDSYYNFDTENGISENIEINGMDAFYISTDLVYTLVWSDNIYAYILSGNLPEKTMLLISENIDK